MSRQKRRKLTDSELSRKARRAKHLEQRAKRYGAMADALKLEVIREFERRGNTRVIESSGVRVTCTRGSTTHYDFPLLMQRLGPKQARQYQKQVVDTTAVGRAVQEGKFSTALLDEITSTTPNKPYLTITFVR